MVESTLGSIDTRVYVASSAPPTRLYVVNSECTSFKPTPAPRTQALTCVLIAYRKSQSRVTSEASLTYAAGSHTVLQRGSDNSSPIRLDSLPKSCRQSDVWHDSVHTREVCRGGVQRRSAGRHWCE